MKIEKITDNIFRVTITLHDLEERNIDINSFDFNSPQTLSLFNELADQVAAQFGFDFKGTQLIVDPVPNVDNSFDITITRLEDDIDFESIHKYIRNKYKRSDVRVKKRAQSVLTDIVACSFDSLDDVCQLCGMIHSYYVGSSTLFKHGSAFSLILSRGGVDAAAERMLDNHICEFGRRIANPVSFEGYVNEHGTKLVEGNAVEVLKGLAG